MESVNYVCRTMCASDKRVSAILDSLSHEFIILSKWFFNNAMVPNPGKCSFMLLGVDDSLQTNLACDNEMFVIMKVLGVTLDNKLNFAIHLPNITKNGNKKFNVLTQAQKNMTTDQESLYNPTLLNVCTKHSLLRINNIHEQWLRLIQQNYISEFERLFENAN